MRRGELDLAGIHTRPLTQPGVTLERVREDEFVAYCLSSHRLAKRRSIALDDLARERRAAASSAAGSFGPLLVLRQAFERRGLPAPQTVLVSDLIAFRLRLIAYPDLLGIAVTEVVETAPRGLGLRVLPVRGLEWGRPVAVACRTDAYLPPPARRFIAILTNTSPGQAR